ncbi:MAG: methyltransferase domain-containing protein [Betaproteobacteria bacterium]
MRLNLGCGRNILGGWINVDVYPLPGVDVVADLGRCGEQPLPFAADSVDEMLLSHVIEHIREPLPLMQELHRVARNAARLVIRVPYGSSDDAYEDPTHVRPYFLNSFGYFSQPNYWRADYGYRGDWTTEQITLVVREQGNADLPPDQILAKVMRDRNVVREMIAELKAVKPVRLPRRELQTVPKIVIQLA